MEIKIGTSGYSFEDWRGTFYPGQIQKGKMLNHYQAYFNTVEINSTYYRIPHPAIMYNIVRKTKPDFDFFVKAYQNLTHQRQDYEKPAREFLESVRQIADTGQLKGILAQFPWSFKFSRPNLMYLHTCRELTAPHPLFIEFRHDSWLRDETYQALEADGIQFVSVDGPRLRGLLPPVMKTTGDIAYVRLHGRNDAKWWNGGPLRYDYDYNESELLEWKEKISALQGHVKQVFVFFNNCHLGQAVKNARQLMKLFDM